MPTAKTPACIWLMGLPGAGKTTLARALKPILAERSGAAVLLDGDELRSGLCSGLGFEKEARLENIRRCSEVAKLVLNSDCSVVASCITPYNMQRELIRNTLAGFNISFVYLSATLEVCEQRDPKGLYRKFREQGPYPLTGKGDPFELPTQPVLTIDTGILSIEKSIDAILEYCLPF